MPLEGDLGSFWVLWFTKTSLGLRHNLFPAKYIWNLYFICHYISKCSYMLISIWWLLYSTTTYPASYAGLLSMPPFLQVVPHSWEYQAQLSSLICKAPTKTRSSCSAVRLDATSSPLLPQSLWANQSVSFSLFRKSPISELVLEAVTSLSSHRAWRAAPYHSIYSNALHDF